MRTDLLAIAYVAAFMLAIEAVLFGANSVKPEYRIEYIVPGIRVGVWLAIVVRVMWTLGG